MSVGSLSDFLIENRQDNVTGKFFLSKRFEDADFEFEIRAMTSSEFAEYQKQCTRLEKGRKVSFDNARFQELICVNHTITPNFKEKAALDKLGVMHPSDYMNIVLNAGEVTELYKHIQELSGFELDMDELRSEVKNSSKVEMVKPGTPTTVPCVSTGNPEGL